jgi:two-component system, OmpR family, phosphate regulon sensor histidine kinase PhoR
MTPARLFWQIAAPLGVLLASGLLVVAWQASILLRNSHSAQIEAQLASSTALVQEALGDSLGQGDRAVIGPIVERVAAASGLRVTVIAPDGTVLGDSESDPGIMDNHGTRPEVVQAVASGAGTAVRYSNTISANMMYAARAMRADGRLDGVVRAGIALSRVEAAERELQRRSAAAVALVGLLMLVCGAWIARRVTRPLEELERVAEAYARGQPGAGEGFLPVSGSILEVQRVAEALQRMATELDNRIAALVAERNEQEAVLSSMVEGVLAIDDAERVMALNAAAARLLDVDARQAIGRTIHEIARNASLQRFVAEALRADSALERDIALHGDESRFVQAHGSPVRDAAGARIGAVVVMNDVTRLRRLETVRRDFVANVSHELKTPVTSIKGFLETLLGGALEDPANARRFVEIAARQADRLGAIIDDLLLLSRIDQDSEHPRIDKSPTALETVIGGAVEVCRPKADQKGVGIRIHAERGLCARLNGAMVEQALVNLIDNAIKYSEAGEEVQISTAREADTLVIKVIDQGPGIEEEHLPRLFERFYRIDKARSRAAGGTGLGLAIVKHIVQAQNGTVGVESRPGAGSTFTLRFPAA